MAGRASARRGIARPHTGRFYHRVVGFNPFRPQNKTMLDVALVVVFVVLALGVVAWGFFG